MSERPKQKLFEIGNDELWVRWGLVTVLGAEWPRIWIEQGDSSGEVRLWKRSQVDDLIEALQELREWVPE